MQRAAPQRCEVLLYLSSASLLVCSACVAPHAWTSAQTSYLPAGLADMLKATPSARTLDLADYRQYGRHTSATSWGTGRCWTTCWRIFSAALCGACASRPTSPGKAPCTLPASAAPVWHALQTALQHTAQLQATAGCPWLLLRIGARPSRPVHCMLESFQHATSLI